jgi:hypothetical protein
MEKDKSTEEKKDNEKNIDYSLYAEHPEKLFSIAQEQFNKNNFEEGLDILEQSINLAVKKFGGEEKVELAQYYNKYADGLIQKLMTSNDDFLNLEEEKAQQGPEPSKEDNEETESKLKDKDKEKVKQKDEKGEEKSNNNEKKSQINEAVGDDEIAYENLNAANLLLKNYLKQFDDKDPKTLDKEIIKYYLLLSDNYSLFASLEKINSDFRKADYYYKLSIDICRKYDNTFSRNLAGLYFEQAQILDFDPKNCFLSLYKSKIIMEHYLQTEIDKAKLNIKLDIDEKDLDLDTLSYDSEKIFKNKDLISKNGDLIKKNPEIEEFVDIINNINIKLEDVILELKEYNLYLKTKEQMKKDGEKQNCFDTNIDMSKVVDLSKITLIKVKRKEPFNDKDDIKKPEDISTKEKKTE